MRKMPLDQATEQFGVPYPDPEDGKNLADSKEIFFWDHRTLSKADSDSPGNDFLKKLDQMLKPHGLEVVKVKFDGDAQPWFIDRIKSS